MTIDNLLQEKLIKEAAVVIPRYVSPEDSENTLQRFKTLVSEYFKTRSLMGVSESRLNILSGLDGLCDRYARLSFREFRNAMETMIVEVLDAYW